MVKTFGFEVAVRTIFSIRNFSLNYFNILVMLYLLAGLLQSKCRVLTKCTWIFTIVNKPVYSPDEQQRQRSKAIE